MQNRRLKKTLDELCLTYNEQFERSRTDFFASRRDPVLFPHRYQSFEDVEAAAFLASTFAYGNVASLCGFIDRLLAWMQPGPGQFLKRGPGAVQELAVHSPYYRLHKSDEILSFLTLLSRVYAEHGALYRVFLSGYYNCNTMKVAATQFVESLRTIGGAGTKFLLPSPQDGSPCKRLNLFLRWMVRRDGIDFGLWREVSPSHLIMPLDTHIGRVAFRLGWIRTPSLSWSKAEEVTSSLRKFDAEDPTRYDFALCHESISKSKWLKNLTADERGLG